MKISVNGSPSGLGSAPYRSYTEHACRHRNTNYQHLALGVCQLMEAVGRGKVSALLLIVSLHNDKKKLGNIFLICKEIQKGSVAKSSISRGFLIYMRNCANNLSYMRKSLVFVSLKDFALIPSKFPIFEQCLFLTLSPCPVPSSILSVVAKRRILFNKWGSLSFFCISLVPY